MSICRKPWASTCVLRCLVAALLQLLRLLWWRIAGPVPAVIPPGVLLLVPPVVCTSATNNTLNNIICAAVVRAQVIAPARSSPALPSS